jgi:hypothetical protein
VARAVGGHQWGGDGRELDLIDNPDVITRLVVFDTWTRNCDRHPPDLATRRPNYGNVFFSEEGANPGRFRLIAMDHTHCFTCGRDLGPGVASIDAVRDERIYGLFPAFIPRMQRAVLQTTLHRLELLDRDTVEAAVGTIPSEWEVNAQAREALVELIVRRARFTIDTVADRLVAACHPYLGDTPTLP